MLASKGLSPKITFPLRQGLMLNTPPRTGGRQTGPRILLRAFGALPAPRLKQAVSHHHVKCMHSSFLQSSAEGEFQRQPCVNWVVFFNARIKNLCHQARRAEMPAAGSAAILPIPQDPRVLLAVPRSPGGRACCLITGPEPGAARFRRTPLPPPPSSLIITKLA